MLMVAPLPTTQGQIPKHCHLHFFNHLHLKAVCCNSSSSPGIRLNIHDKFGDIMCMDWIGLLQASRYLIYCRRGNCLTLQIHVYWVNSQWQPTYKTDEVKIIWNFAYVTSSMFQGYINSFSHLYS